MSILLPIAFFSGMPGPGELIVVFLVVLVLFGPKRLPEIARTIGKALAQLRRASSDFKDQIMRIDEPPVYDLPPDPGESSVGMAENSESEHGEEKNGLTDKGASQEQV